MILYHSGADTPVAKKRPTGAPAPPLIGRPTGGFTRRSECPLIAPRPRFLASVARPGIRRVAAGSTVGQDGPHADYCVLSATVVAAPVLSRRRSPCPRGRRLPGPLPRVAGRPFRTPFRTAGKKCVAKCATQFLLIGGKRRSTPITTTYAPGSSISV